MAIYVGYARVSTQKQSLSRQVTNIRNLYPDIKIYSDKYTGTKLDRPNFQLLLSIVRPGDTIVFDSVSRMSRNAEEGYELYMELYEKGINLEFINEPHISSEYFRRASESLLVVLEMKLPTSIFVLPMKFLCFWQSSRLSWLLSRQTKKPPIPVTVSSRVYESERQKLA